MKKILYAVITGIIAIYAFVKVVNELDKYMAASPPANQLQRGYTLSDKETYILNYLLEDEIKAFSNGNPGILNAELTAVSVGKVSAAYNQNEVSADQSYYDKMLLLSGII